MRSEIEPRVDESASVPRHLRWLVVMMPFTAGCQVAISRKFSSITQSNSSSGRALFASLRAGSAWMRSPSEVSLINSILFIFPRKEPLQERAEAVPLQVALADLFGCDVVE